MEDNNSDIKIYPPRNSKKLKKKNNSNRQKRGGIIRRFLSMFFVATNPGLLIKKHLTRYPWPWALFVSGAAFTLFYYQTALDLARVEELEAKYTQIMAIKGFLFGTFGVAVLALLGRGLIKKTKRKLSNIESIKAFGLGYAPALIYTASGIAFNRFLSWNTALSFGVPGVLWAIRPMRAALKEMCGGKWFYAFVISALFGLIMFFAWSWLIEV